MTIPELDANQISLLALLLGIFVGALLAWLLTRIRAQRREHAASLAHTLELGEMREQQARLEVHIEGESRSAAEKLELLKGARKQLEDEFSLLANRIFEEKSQRFVKTNRETLQATLDPLKTQLKDFRTRVEDVYDKETRDRMSLQHELNSLKQINLRMSEDALNLTRALKGDKKTQGNWGEIVLERVLEESGLRRGHEYETQFSATAEDGQRRQPDVVVRLPEGRDIVIDSKMSLVAYEQYVSCEDEHERKQFLAAHVQAVKQHIDSLSLKGYERLEGVNSLDFVLLFIPIESAFMAAFDSDPSMFSSAYDKQIIVVSPTTLLATLRTVQTLWRYEHQNRNSEKIAAQAGAIHDQFAMVLESLEEVGKHIDRAQESWDKTRMRLNAGRGNLVKRVKDLEKLGARTKRTLPTSMVLEDVGDEHETDSETNQLEQQEE
jgi:DNA recombination protein RmuC